MRRAFQKIAHLSGILLCGLILSPAFAQATDETEAVVTSVNDPGYKGLVEANDLADSSDLCSDLRYEKATLQEYGKAFADPKILKAFALLLKSLAGRPTPTLSPESLTEERNLDLTNLPDLLNAKQRLLLAEGRTGEALDLFQRQIQLGRAIALNSVWDWRDGVDMESATVEALACCLPQFSVRDCNRVMAMVQEWDNGPDTLASALERSRRKRQAQLMALPSADMEAFLAPFDADPDIYDRLRRFGRMSQQEHQARIAKYKAQATQTRDILTRLSPLERRKTAEQTAQKLDQDCRQVLLERDTPYEKHTMFLSWRRERAQNAQQIFDDTFHVPMDSTEIDRWTEQQTWLHLLYCHAAIRRYQWLHDKLPASLKVLKLGKMALDPFGSGELVYKVSGERYTLESVGAAEPDETGKLNLQKRTPITLPAEDTDETSSDAGDGEANAKSP